LSGELSPDAGRSFLDGRDVSGLPVHRRARLGLGRTFQISSVLSSFTVRENVAIGVQARSRGVFRSLRTATSDPELEEGAERVLRDLSMRELATRPASTLAHGERRLLELAIAIAQRPRVLLLDEPLAGVGPAEAEHLLALLRALKQEMALVLVEHDMDAVFRVSDRLTVLAQGRCIASGVPDVVRREPSVRTLYLGDF
jgi:branched-chain amino acid transport system ATP-binding protein